MESPISKSGGSTSSPKANDHISPFDVIAQSSVAPGGYLVDLTKPVALSPIEKAVLLAYARGWWSKEIARQLDISQRAVVNHATVATRRLGARTTTQGIIVAVAKGLLLG